MLKRQTLNCHGVGIPGSNLDTEMSVEVFVALYSHTL